MVRIVLFAVCCLLAQAAYSTQTIRYIEPFYGNDAKDKSYVASVLRRAVAISNEKFGDVELEALPTPMLQGRQFRALDTGEIDLMWSMTSRTRENKALPIRIPVTMGLIGFRVFVIKSADQARFAEIEDIAELKKLLAIQGHDWPDTEILQANGFNVHGVSWRDKMYKLLARSHYDYFPRGVTEVGRELNDLDKNHTLALERKWMLYYPTATYFFVRKGNTELAERIEWGLNQMVDSGELRQMLFSHPIHKDALRMAHVEGRTLVELRNPVLPDNAPTLNPKYWVTYEELVQYAY
ncbi:hypothetical protein AAEU32_09935 [Pseudoalteromonas sp. SSDWG2]|uniref:hypothetical protein n=1 Tax=Pseudoalteromonas sp. SSDWG2 TaxID=3139391 RepID=UPI003BAB59B0